MILFCFALLLLFLCVFFLRYTVGGSGMGPAFVSILFFILFFGIEPLAMLLLVSALPLSLFNLIAVPLSLLLHFISLCGALVVLVFLYGLPCTAYMVAFLALRVLYVVVLGLFRFCFLVFLPKSLPGDDVLCRLLPRPLPSVCFLPRLFVLFFLAGGFRPCSFPIFFCVTFSIL